MIVSSADQESPEIFPQDPRILNDMINVYRRNRVNGKIRSNWLLKFCKDGKDKIEGEVAKTKKDNLEGKYPTRFDFLDKYSVGELKDLSFGLGLKINKVKTRIEFLKSQKISDFEKLDGRDSLKMPLNTPNPITIMTRIDHNSNDSFGSDICHVESSGSSNATAVNGYYPVMLMGQNLLGHESNSVASTMSKDDDNSFSDGVIEPKVVQQLEQPQIMDLLSCFRP